MGVVYKVEFPDGSFYIGATINLKNRMMQHRYHPSNKLLKAKIKEFKMSKAEFIQLFSILHEGDDFKEVERGIIEKVRKNQLCLNLAGVKSCHKERIQRRIIQSSVEYDIYCSFEDVMKFLNTNTEGVINYLVKLHKADQERKARSFHE